MRLQCNHFNLLVRKDTWEVDTTTATNFDWLDMTSINMDDMNSQVNNDNTRTSEPDETQCSKVFKNESERRKRVKSKKDKSKAKENGCESQL